MRHGEAKEIIEGMTAPQVRECLGNFLAIVEKLDDDMDERGFMFRLAGLVVKCREMADAPPDEIT